MTRFTSLVSSLLLASQANAALEPIVSKGSKLFFQNGTQFFMKGIAYQQDVAAGGGETKATTYLDPLADAARCREDIPIMAKAGTNIIRVYQVDPTADHSECMSLLDQFGIYLIADLGVPRESIDRDRPTWTTPLFDRYKAVIDELAQYSNTVGFFAGNEVSNNNTNTECSAFVKAAVRDCKKHIKDNHPRWMGVGYAANDDAQIRINSAHYFNCGPQDDAIDFWGYNIYSWCGDSSYTISGYDKQVEFFSNYSVPVFFAESGCNTVGGAEGRKFDDVTAMYSSQMTDVFSGNIVYMYFQETNDYGLVRLQNGKAQTMRNYAALSSKVLAAKPTGVAMSSYAPTNKPAECPATSDIWEVSGNGLPPTPDRRTCSCMYDSLSCKPQNGLDIEDYGDIFGFICGEQGNPCSGISTNTATGTYGAFSMCNDTEKLGHVMDTYFKQQNSRSDACDHGGKAQMVKPARAQGDCDGRLETASSVNSFVATATSAPTSGGSPTNAAANVHVDRAFNIGGLAIGAYMLVAMGAGAGMLLL